MENPETHRAVFCLHQQYLQQNLYEKNPETQVQFLQTFFSTIWVFIRVIIRYAVQCRLRRQQYKDSLEMQVSSLKFIS